MKRSINDKILKKRKSILFPLILIVILIFSLVIITKFEIEKDSKSKIPFIISPYLRIKTYPWQKYYSTLDKYLLNYSKINIPPLPEELIEKPDNPIDLPGEISPIAPDYYAYFTASMTSSPGSIGVFGTSNGFDVFINGNKVNKDHSGNFTGGVGSGFTILFKRYGFERKVSVNSPAYGTNFVLESLSLTIDPINLLATLSGKVNLNLPGEIKGTFFNASNGGASGTVLKNGNFTVAVPLSKGINNLTASGSWLTIKLDLPTIVVTIE